MKDFNKYGAQDMTILVASCKKYSDVLHVFEQLFIRYWEDCPYDIVLSTDFNAEPYSLDYANVIASGDIPNGTRDYYALQTITTPYVLWLAEDFWLTNNVSNSEILRFLEYAKKYDAGCIRLRKPPLGNYDVFDNNNNLFIVGQGAYKVVTHGAIWETRFLMSLLEKYDNVWEFERKASYDSIVYDRLVLAARRYTFPVVLVVWRGRLIKKSVGIMKAHGIDIGSMNRRVESTWEFLREKFKGVIFRACPNLVTKTLNALGSGYKRNS